MKKLFTIALSALLGLSVSFPCVAQQQGDNVDFQTWSDITLSYFLSQKLSIGGDAGLRGVISARDWNLFYIRPSINYRFSGVFRVTGGIGTFNTFNKEFSNSYELRFFQDAHIAWPDIGWVDFYHRFRLEERFFFYQTLDSDFSARARYLFRARTINFKLIGNKKGYYLKAMWEVFVPLGNSAAELFVNNQRWYAALGFQPSDRFRYELHYIWQKSREFEDDGFRSTENIFRIRVFYTIKLPDQE